LVSEPQGYPFAAGLLLVCVVPALAQDLFPDGPGKDILATKCRTCHMPDRVTKVAGRTAATWQTLVTTMINRGAPVTEDEIPILVEYLAKNWPVDKVTAVVTFAPVTPMASHVKAEFTEWDVRTPASRPTASLAVSDGSIWYTSAAENALGRLDPKTGEIKEYELKTPQSVLRALSKTATATSGTPPSRQVSSASSIRRPGTSPNTRCPIQPRAIRTRRSSTETACSGSQCNRRTWWARSIREAAPSS
jgi:hypothetical protein